MSELENVLANIVKCLETPLVIDDSETRKKKLERERKLVEHQEQLYAPKYSTLQKQFTV